MDLIKTHDPYPPDTLAQRPDARQRPQSRPDPDLKQAYSFCVIKKRKLKLVSQMAMLLHMD